MKTAAAQVVTTGLCIDRFLPRSVLAIHPQQPTVVLLRSFQPRVAAAESPAEVAASLLSARACWVHWPGRRPATGCAARCYTRSVS